MTKIADFARPSGGSDGRTYEKIRDIYRRGKTLNETVARKETF